MNRIIYFIIFNFISFSNLAQDNYVSFSAGYGCQTFKNQVESFYNTVTDNQTANINQPAFSLGKGIYANISAGRFFASNYGFDLSIQYQYGLEHHFNQQTMIINVLSNLNRYLSGNRLIINPSFILRPEPGLVTPYLKFGPSIGFINQQLVDIITLDTNISKKTWKYSGPVSLGINTTIGLYYEISDNMRISFEITQNTMTYKPDRVDLEISLKNGIRNENDLLYFEKHIVFQDWTEEPFNQPPQDPEKPVIMITPTFAYNNINISIGAIYSF